MFKKLKERHVLRELAFIRDYVIAGINLAREDSRKHIRLMPTVANKNTYSLGRTVESMFIFEHAYHKELAKRGVKKRVDRTDDNSALLVCLAAVSS